MIGTSQKPVYADRGTESDVKSHLYSSFDCLTDNRMTFDEFAAVHGFSLQPKEPVLTMKVEDQHAWPDNARYKISQTRV